MAQARTIFGELEDLTAHELAATELDRQRHRLEMAIEASDMPYGNWTSSRAGSPYRTAPPVSPSSGSRA